MIILFEQDEQDFKTLGIGVLRDAISCKVTEELNGSFELEMEYPINGQHYNDIEIRRIIFAKPNEYSDNQPFRIYEISKPINGIVTISAEHISYDMSGYPVSAFTAKGIVEALDKIQNGCIGNKSPFIFSTDKTSEIEMTTLIPYNMRSLLAGNSGSLLDIYGGEYEFDKFSVKLLNKRGLDRGVTIRYSKNMTDLEQEVNASNLYSMLYPFYYAETSETETKVETYFQQGYIISGQEPLSKEWLSLTEDGLPFIPTEIGVPIQIATQGEYFERKFCWDGSSYYEDPEIEPNLTRTVTETKTVKHFVDLDEKLLPIIENPKFNRILTLDMTSFFSDIPDKDLLKSRAEAYIKENKLGEIKESITVSFIKLSDSPEYKQFHQLETVQLGDTIKVIYDELGVSSSLEVISTLYDCLTEKYEEIELGTKSSSLSDNAMVTSDNISSMTNDARYTDVTTVNNLIAKKITADFIEALQVKITNGQVTGTLDAKQINCSGVITAATYQIDKIVSKLLTVENAEIYKKLTAGEISVKGNIDITSGSISISDDENNTNFEVDNKGNVKANSVDLEGKITATSGEIGGCVIDKDGNLIIPSINIEGRLTAEQIDASELKVKAANIEGTLTAEQIDASELTVQAANVEGTLEACDINIGYGNFVVDDDGNLKTQSDIEADSITVDTNIVTGSITVRETISANEINISGINMTPVINQAESEIITIEVVTRHEQVLNGYRIVYTVTSSKPLYSDASIIIDFPYTDRYTGKKLSRKTRATILAGKSSAKFVTTLPIEAMFMFPPDVTWYPQTISNVITQASKSLLIDSNLEPSASSSRLNLGSSENRWSDIYSQNELSVISDKRLKTDVNYNLKKYDTFFDMLRPVSFKLQNGTSDRTHIGLISQDVRDAIINSGLSTKDFAGYLKSLKKDDIQNPTEEDFIYGIRYGELHGLEIYEIQKLKKENEELKERLNRLEDIFKNHNV